MVSTRGTGHVLSSQSAVSRAVARGLLAVDDLIAAFLEEKRHESKQPLTSLIGLLTQYTQGGKRLRPELCLRGWHAAGNGPVTDTALHLAASLELFHTFAILQDDVMDHSVTRRGRQTMHQVIAAENQSHSDPAQFGKNAAILLGDLVLGWSYELVQRSGMDPARSREVLPLMAAMRTETFNGQYLDLAAGTKNGTDLEAALRIVREKSARYTVQRPLQLGAVLADASPELVAECGRFGLPLGEAFQLRDDLLGVFGDCAHTGKSAADDLREGKQTVLLAIALARADSRQAGRLNLLMGDPSLSDEGAREVREIFDATGARSVVEAMITARGRTALDALAGARPPVADAFRPLVGALLDRDH